MKKAEKKPKKKEWHNIEIVIASFMLIFSVEAFFGFFRDNRQQILKQTNSYIEDSTRQTCARLQDVLMTAQRDIRMLAGIYGQLMTEPAFDADILQRMAQSAVFDSAEFISADGEVLTASGETADLSEMAFYLDGMKGNSGKTILHDSAKLIFYTPFYYKGEIIGVLNGVLRENTIDNILTTNYFGVQTRSYLIDREGDIILSHGERTNATNLVDALVTYGHLSDKDRKNLEEVLDNTNDVDVSAFNYTGSNGTGSAYIMSLSEGWGGDADEEWLLVQAIPSMAIQNQAKRFNSAGIALGLKLLIMAAVYVAYLMWRYRKRRKSLLSQNVEFSRIIDAIMTLFSGYVIVDLDKDAYTIHGELGVSDIKQESSYTEMIHALDARFLSDNGNYAPMTYMLSAKNIREHLTEEVPYLQYEYELALDNGSSRWESISILCLERADGVPSKALLAIQDTDALKRQEMRVREALQAITAASEAANRSKTDFLARMSHDMRTPMNAIMGMTAIALRHLDSPERLTDCLNKIDVSSRHLLSLINDVLDMSKIESGKITLSEEPFNIADLTDGVLAIIRTQAEHKNQEMKVHIADIQHEDVIGDTLRLRQVLINILGNAVKFTPEGGTITFSIRERPLLYRNMVEYEFVCEDNGIGMDAEFVKTIFEPFTRAKNAVKRNIEGTGLGMSITRSIVQMMDGDIQVRSEAGTGSVFQVRVHLKQQEPGAGDVTGFEGLHVLVADDDQDCCVNTCEVLDSIGVNAQWVLSGEEAVHRTVEAHRDGNDFAAVILDWKMPGKNGVDTAMEIRREVGEGIPIIILSAYDWSDIEEEASEAGIGAFVAKPLFKSRLIYALKSVMPKAAQKQRAAEPQGEPDYQGKLVLLVDDNELNREIGVELLSMAGVNVETAEDGQIALDMVKYHPADYYDLIFMDIQMPGVDGYEASRAIRDLGREDTRRIPIVALSANAFDNDVRKAKEAGMNDHLSKPVEYARLQEILSKWL